jgi:hypothetical protein
VARADRPEADRAEAEMSTGQLRVRIRAYEREKTWAPDYVADQLAGTREAADKHRTDAALWHAKAPVTVDDDRPSSRLRADAAHSAALAEALDERARQLAEADEVRAVWYAHTAETRAAAERAAAELAVRRADLDAEPPPVAAKEWLAAHDAASRAEDPHRRIVDEHDLAETVDQRARDQREAGPAEPPPESAGTYIRDIREEISEDPTATKKVDPGAVANEVRVPTADETAESVRRAQRALQELKQRQTAEAHRAEDDAREAARRPTDVDRHMQQELASDAVRGVAP